MDKAAIAELVQRKVDVIVTSGTSPTQAAQSATSTIPVVMTFVSDPVGQASSTTSGGRAGISQDWPPWALK